MRRLGNDSHDHKPATSLTHGSDPGRGCQREWRAAVSLLAQGRVPCRRGLGSEFLLPGFGCKVERSEGVSAASIIYVSDCRVSEFYRSEVFLTLLSPSPYIG